MSRAECYDIDGNVQTDSYPCSFGGDVTAAQCCHANDTCMSNGLCYPKPELQLLTPYFVFGCTDADWRAEECLDTCLRIPDGGDGIAECGGGYYCCFGIGGCECTDTDATSVLSLAVTRAVATIPPASVWEPASTASSVTPSSGGPETTAQTTATSLPPATGMPQASGASSSTPTNGGESSDDSNTTALGAGLGAGLGVAAIGLVGGIFWFIRRRRQRKQTDQLPGYSKDPGYMQHAQAPPAEMAAHGDMVAKRQTEQELDGRAVVDRTAMSPTELPTEPLRR